MVTSISPVLQKSVWDLFPVQYKQVIKDTIENHAIDDKVLASYFTDFFGKDNIYGKWQDPNKKIAEVCAKAFEMFIEQLADMDPIARSHAKVAYGRAIDTLCYYMFGEIPGNIKTHPKFVTGDKVCQSEYDEFPDIVRSCYFNPARQEYMYTLENIKDNDDVYIQYPESELVKFEEKPDIPDKVFKMYDKVVVISGEYKGSKGTVIDDDITDDSIGVDLDDRLAAIIFFSPDELEIQHDTPVTPDNQDSVGETGAEIDTDTDPKPEVTDVASITEPVNEPDPIPYTKPTEMTDEQLTPGTKVMYNGMDYEIECKTGNDHFALKGLKFDVHRADLEPYTPVKLPSKYKVSDKVVQRDSQHLFHVVTRVSHDIHGNPVYELDNEQYNIPEHTLRPNYKLPAQLHEILKIGQQCWSSMVGPCVVKSSTSKGIKISFGGGVATICIQSDGRYSPDGDVVLWPDYGTYLTHPGNPESTWEHWYRKKTEPKFTVIVRTYLQTDDNEPELRNERSYTYSSKDEANKMRKIIKDSLPPVQAVN